jgi:hypothetical protein
VYWEGRRPALNLKAISMNSSTTLRRQITLPEPLCASAEQQFGAHFESIETLLEFVLNELLRRDVEILDKSEQAVLDQRLRDLGYL